MKQKFLILLMALALPMMVSCSSDEDDTTVESYNRMIIGKWHCNKYEVDGQRFEADDYFIEFVGSESFDTNMPCFIAQGGNCTYEKGILKIGNDSYRVKLYPDRMEIYGRTPDNKLFEAWFVLE
jgi:hypothetical protein